eukprot:jgi/Bigna1/128872/aug1.7_g3580
MIQQQEEKKISIIVIIFRIPSTVLLVQQTEVTNRQVTRASRRLFIGNLPSALGLTEILIFNFFTDACNQAGIVADENPVLGVEIRPNNKFCFVEFRSYKLATEAMEKLQEYQEIRNEIGDECNKFGHLVDVVIPRAGGQDFDDDEDNSEDEDEGGVPGLGKVFLQYATKEDAARARATLHGRRFSENLVEARFFPEDRFLAKDYGFEA